jgi:serine/threonine protein kinase
MPLEEGADFAGFTVVRLLGSGGMGEVYLAQHPRLPRLEALKVLRTDVSADPGFRDRFIREADLASSLWHPNLVAVHDRGDHNGLLWMSMDYVDGADCGLLLAERDIMGMPAHRVSEIVTAIADALDDAHGHGLLHRDIKPSNIMITNPDHQGMTRTLLTDFGIARNVDDVTALTVTTMTVGTVAYSAPEQLMGNPIDGRADQYALAATAYHLLTGAQLFPNPNAVAVISAHLTAPPPQISRLRPELSGLDTVLARGLAKNPEDRFASCKQFAEALGEMIPGHADGPTQGALNSPVSTMPPPIYTLADSRIGQRPGNRSAKRPLLIALSVFVTLALVALGATFAAKTLTASGPDHHPVGDREAALMAGQRYLEALAVGDAHTALSLSAAQPVTAQLLTDAALHRQLAATPINNIAVQFDSGVDPAQPVGSQRLVLSADFGHIPSRTVMGLRKVDGQWKLDTGTVAVDVGDPASGNLSLKAVAISGVPTNGVSPLAIFPGTPVVSSSNKYLDISAETAPLLLESLTNTAPRPSIQPTIVLNDAGRQASVAALEARIRYCYGGGRVPPAECCPCVTKTPDGQPLKPESIEVVRLDDAYNMNYDLDAQRMIAHLTGTAMFTFRGEGPSGPTEFPTVAQVNNLVDINRDPPVYAGKASPHG